LKRRIVKYALIAATAVWASDTVYKIVSGVSYTNREKCVLFRVLPRPGFIVFEYLAETLIIVFVSTFIAVWLARRFSRFSRFYPRGPLAAFAYGSLIPVCSCAAIPLVESMKGRMRFPTTLSFVLAAPLLSPNIMVLSFSVLGFRYGLLRIASSLVLVMATVAVLGRLQGRGRSERGLVAAAAGCKRACSSGADDIYLETFAIFRRLLPYLVVAGAVGIGLELLGPRTALLTGRLGRGPAGIAAWIVVGIPFYFCNGAEVLFLRPLMSHGFPVGTGIAFSLTSTAVCLTSMAMFGRMIGARLTLIMIGCIFAISALIAILLNLAF
jgi:uncharacterized membrane protein YraQ (UPF0718 family)